MMSRIASKRDQISGRDQHGDGLRLPFIGTKGTEVLVRESISAAQQ
jgi:hypothetical protein